MSPQSTSSRKCWTARLSINPRHMSAVASSSTRCPMDTTLMRPPGPSALGSMRRSSGVIFFVAGSPPRRPPTPSMRGTEYPQMSASSTPTVKPRAARPAAMFTVIDDLPTPPFPEAIMITLAVAGICVSGADSALFQRALAMAAAFSSWVSSVQSIPTLVTPGSDPTRALTSFWICARKGQPAVVSAIRTRTAPSGSTVAPLAMPRSTMSEPSSGSMTPRRSPMIAAGLGGAVKATDPFYRTRPCNLVRWPENPRTMTRPSVSTPTCRRASRS